MTKRSRIILAAASLALLLLYVLPLWKIDLDAPQYPEGLGMVIEINTIRGAEPGNLESINGLNHYIGMKEIVPEAIPELRIMPWVFAFLIAFGLAGAALGKRWMLYTWVGLFLVIMAAAMVDFYLWGYDYGHNLDTERAIIKIPDMTYQPPVIGTKQMLNIKAGSWPAIGGWVAALSFLAGAVAIWLERKRPETPEAGAERAPTASEPVPVEA